MKLSRDDCPAGFSSVPAYGDASIGEAEKKREKPRQTRRTRRSVSDAQALSHTRKAESPDLTSDVPEKPESNSKLRPIPMETSK